METLYDWITVMIFAGLVTLFLVQSVSPLPANDRMWHYLVPACGCAVANWLGNEGHDLFSWSVIALVLLWVRHFFWAKREVPPHG